MIPPRLGRTLPAKTTRIGLISLGCAKNLVDAEIMLGALLKAGLEVTNDPEDADAIIINTCSFIGAAQEESVDTILESIDLRRTRRPDQALVVSGCLPQRFREDLPDLLPEVDAFMGIDQVTRIASIVDDALARRAERKNWSNGKPTRAQRKLIDRLAKLEKNHHTTPVTSKKTLPSQSLATHTQPQAQEVLASTPIVEVTQKPAYIPDFATPRFRLTPRHTAYVKIAEGCNHPCTFCIIPRMRGSHRSRPKHDIVREALQLIDDDVKELNLVSQDSTYYGLDLRPNRQGSISSPEKFNLAAKQLPRDATTLCSLLRDLNSLKGNFWIRLLYTHPAHWTDDLIQTIAECSKVARYVDLPLQHIHDNMLERMRRETSRQHIVDLIHRIRAGVPGIAIRTTFIVGFPGETEACFETLLEFIRETRFERLGVFTYSREDGTRAGSMSNQIPERVKRRRQKLAMEEQLKVSRGLGRSFLGRTLNVLVEKAAGGEDARYARLDSREHGMIRKNGTSSDPSTQPNLVLARSESDAPDIDGRVYVRGRLPIGQFARVKVLDHTDFDLIAEPI